MAFNHDNFVTRPNYTELSTLLTWYIQQMEDKIPIMEKLAAHRPKKGKDMYRNDPVMKKIYRIEESLSKFKQLARIREDDS